MLNISAQSDYGMLLISHLIKSDTYQPLSLLIKKTGLPARYMARIAATLSSNKILDSHEGKIGGYRLSKRAKTISLYDYLKIFEGEIKLVKCQYGSYKCPWHENCQHKSFLKNKLGKILIKELRGYRLLDLFESK